jgi:DNA helicase-2/ATP-dependent DNA helicase PcrA
VCTVQGVPDPLLDDLDTEQRAAVTSAAAPLAILAPAGSGKTRVLTRRIAYQVREGRAVARHVLAVTFTRRAAGELVGRITDLGVDGLLTAGTFHAVALAQLRERAEQRSREVPQVLDRKARLVGPLAGDANVADLVSEIEWAQARMIPPERYALAVRANNRRVGAPVERVAAVYQQYRDQKRTKHLLDFDDVLWQCARAIETDEEFAAAQRWRFRHVFVDEFQDATPLQARLLGAWLGGRPDLTVVGDPAQSIYGFSGADAEPLMQFDLAYDGGSTIVLERNYRSAPAIVRAAETPLATVDVGARATPRAMRTEPALPTITAYDSAVAEAEGVAQACVDAHRDGVPWARMAVLFRTNAQATVFETAFGARNVPVRLADDAPAAPDPAVRAVFTRLYELEQLSPSHALGEHLAELAADTGSFASLELRNARDRVVARGREYVAFTDGTGRTRAFAQWLDRPTQAPRHAAVSLLTFHRAKGLEWSLVFVTGLELGLVPISWAGSPDAQAEERRLLHVALSRAEQFLHCSWARSRIARERTVAREPSPWLADVARIAAEPAAPPRSAADHLVDLRAALAASTPPAPPADRARRLRR